MTYAEVPDSIQALLEEMIASLKRELPDFLSAFYLHGSIALNAYNPQISDIDYIAVINRTCTQQDLDCLSKIHADLSKKYPSEQLSGSYLQVSDLGKLEECIAQHPHYHDNQLHPSGYHDINLITWWIVKNRGITLYGKSAQELDIYIDWDEIRASTLHNMNTYWVQFIRNPSRIICLLSDYGIQWAVLGVLRQYVTLKEGEIVSKTGAGHYALKELPQQRHKLIQEAINLREHPEQSLYPLRIVRALDAFRFLRYIIQACNNEV